jgi:hypothetical protein
VVAPASTNPIITEVVAPELEFRNVGDWTNIPGVKFGLHAIFWSPELDDWAAF